MISFKLSIVLCLLNFSQASYERATLEGQFSQLHDILLDGDALNNEMTLIDKALKDAEKAIETSFRDLSYKEEEIILLSSHIKEASHFKQSLETSALGLQMEIIEAQKNLELATNEWFGLDSELQRVKSGAMPITSEISACQDRGGLLAQSNVNLQDTLARMNSSLSLVQQTLYDERIDLSQCNQTRHSLDMDLEDCNAKWKSAQVKYKHDLSELEVKSKNNIEKVRKLTAEGLAKDNRIRSLEKSLANRTVATKKAEAKSMILSDQNQQLLGVEVSLRLQLQNKSTIIRDLRADITQTKHDLETEQELTMKLFENMSSFQQQTEEMNQTTRSLEGELLAMKIDRSNLTQVAKSTKETLVWTENQVASLTIQLEEVRQNNEGYLDQLMVTLEELKLSMAREEKLGVEVQELAIKLDYCHKRSFDQVVETAENLTNDIIIKVNGVVQYLYNEVKPLTISSLSCCSHYWNALKEFWMEILDRYS